MWKSLLEYIKALGRWTWVVLLGIIGAITGAILDVTGIKFPTIVWVLLLAIGLPVASFIAFHNVRVQRDVLLQQQTSIDDRYFLEPINQFLTKEGIVYLTVMFKVNARVIVLDLLLYINDLPFMPLKWVPFSAYPQYTGNWGFDLSGKLERDKKYIGKLIAKIDNKEHESREFEVYT